MNEFENNNENANGNFTGDFINNNAAVGDNENNINENITAETGEHMLDNFDNNINEKTSASEAVNDSARETENLNNSSQNSTEGDYGYRVYNSVGETIKSQQPVYDNANNNYPYSQQYVNRQNLQQNSHPAIQFAVNKKKKNHKFAKRFAAVCATIGVFGCSVGFGVILGTKTTENLPVETGDYLNFKFQNNSEIEQLSLSDNNEIINIVKNTSSSVVNISIKAQQVDFFNQVYENTGSGSGIIYKEDNDKYYIVTNCHVIEDATSVNISITGTEQIPAKLVGKDAQADVAVISVSKADVANANVPDVKVAEFADSDKVEVGEFVLAIGNALGQGKTVTQGIISAQNKEINIDGRNRTVLQTDAAINPGNSGGALVNYEGKIIGMNTAKRMYNQNGSTVEGTGYALPSSNVKSIADELITNGTVSRPYLGISGFTITEDFKATYNLNINGIFIKSVEEGSAAKSAGLKYSDIITGIGDMDISTMEQLSAEISKHKVGDTISINIIRNGYQPMTVNATLMDMNSKF